MNYRKKLCLSELFYNGDNMGIKIIATDLDGTLMSPDHMTVTERTRKALFEARNRGVKIAVATGRTLKFIESVLNQIPFADYVIYSNGASVFDRKLNRDIYKKHIPAEDTADILHFLDGLPVYYNVYSGGRIYIQVNKQRYYNNNSLPEAFLKEFVAASEVCDSLEEELKGKSTEIFSVYSMSPQNEKMITDFLKSKNLLLTTSVPDEIEATAENVNKGTALKGLCDELGITADEVMAFGDAMNDSHMLKFAGYSFAMGNAAQELKKLARYVTAANADDGVAQAVEKYVLTK